jgi:predicted GIY-YIG superfamily endonuclease
MIYWVYEIKIDGVRRYVGITNDLIKREKQHNYLLNKQKSKILYNNIKSIKEHYKITLKKITAFDSKVEARRYECLIILMDHFKNNLLWQRVPRISDI